MTEKRVMTKEECWAAEDQAYTYLQDRLEEVGTTFLCSRDPEEKNLLHKLLLPDGDSGLQHRISLKFVQRMLGLCRKLVSQTDIYGDTPAHIFARYDPYIRLLDYDAQSSHQIDDAQSSHQNYDAQTNKNIKQLVEKLIQLIDKASHGEKDPWLMQNMEGNTPLHEAISSKFVPVLAILRNPRRGTAELVNKRKETVIHLLATRYPIPFFGEDAMNEVIERTKAAHHILDDNGRSPIMRAFEAGNFEFAKSLCSICPEAAETRDLNGRTFWHLLVYLPPMSFDFANSSLTREDVRIHLEEKDNDGKTALHLAIECRRFDLAELFLGLHGTLTSNGTPIFQEHLLKIPNTEGITPGDMIGELPYVPPQFEEFVGKVSTMIGIRSIWGIPSTQIKDYVNTMGVIAALLTTITFTAAFTVPGGLNQEDGTPLLIKNPSFLVFIVSDILAMCLSMMVLFCLLWIMATGNRSKSVVLLDFSIILLLASFYTTLVTFMTGLYATTHLVNHWVAIFALVLCSMLLLLMHKYLVTKFIIPSGKAMLIYADRAIQYGRKLRKKIVRLITEGELSD